MVHLEEALLRAGEYVRPGMKVGLVGTHRDGYYAEKPFGFHLHVSVVMGSFDRDGNLDTKKIYNPFTNRFPFWKYDTDLPENSDVLEKVLNPFDYKDTWDGRGNKNKG